MSEIYRRRVPVADARPPSRSELAPGLRLPRGTWLGVLVGGTGLFELLQQTLIATRNPNLVPALILAGALAVPAAFVAFVYGRRLPYDVPGGVNTITAVTGGVIGIVVAGTLEYATRRRLGMLPLIAVGLIEEMAKLIIPALILLWALPAPGLLSPAAHMAWTGLTAAALWSAAASHWSRLAVLRCIGAFLLAVALHTAWDSIGTIVGYVILAVVGLAALTVIAPRMRVPG